MDEAEKELHKYMIRPVKVILVKVSVLSKSNLKSVVTHFDSSFEKSPSRPLT
jgi:hypothetical protein